MDGESSPQSPTSRPKVTFGRSPVTTLDQRVAAFTNAARCEAVIAVVRQSVMAYPVPPPPVHDTPLNTTGAPVMPATLAVSVLGPASGPIVQLPADAMPLPLVVAVAEPTLPPPEVTVKVTCIPAMGFPPRSCTTTEGAVGTAAPAMAAWLCPTLMVMVPPSAARAVNTTGGTVVPGKVAVSVLVPPAEPSVQLPTTAPPLESVVCVAPVTLPPPEVTVNCTDTPATGLAKASRTSTRGDVPTVADLAAVWLFPAATAAAAAVPGTAVALNCTSPSPDADAITCCVLPAALPSVQVTMALPSAPVTACAADTEPPPTAMKETVTPATGAPSRSRAPTDTCCGSATPAAPVCPSPPAFCSEVATCATCTAPAPATPPEVAVMEAEPLLTAVTTALSPPAPATVTAAELEDQVRAAPRMALPFWSLTVACTTWVAPTAFSETVAGDTTTDVATDGVLPPSLHPEASRAIAEQSRSLRMMGELPGRVSGGGACRRRARDTRSSTIDGKQHGRAGRTGARGANGTVAEDASVRGSGSGRVRRARARGTRQCGGVAERSRITALARTRNPLPERDFTRPDRPRFRGVRRVSTDSAKDWSSRRVTRVSRVFSCRHLRSPRRSLIMIHTSGGMARPSSRHDPVGRRERDER